MKINNKYLIFSFLFSSLFFILSFLTLKDYGISPDEIIHFRRGEAYIHFFLTEGKTNYNDLPKYNLQGTNGDPSKISPPRRSIFQNDIQNGAWFLAKDVGHPPLNDEIAAFLNVIFYQKLGILGDVFSLHLFNILTSTLLVFIVTYFASIYIGSFGALIAGLTISTYPLFWSESHFNIKDPAETCFFTLAILFFSLSLEKVNKKLLFFTYVFLGLALSVKLNILFLPLILVPYLLIRRPKKINKSYLILLIFGPIISLSIFIISWPYLWHDPINRIFEVAKYYKEIGTGNLYQPLNFYIAHINTYPLLWIIFTTPPFIIFLALIGSVASLKSKLVKFKLHFLWLLWLFIPILRVSLPGSSIYGGVRQIMEFLPALAILSGLGAKVLLDFLRAKFGRILFILFVIINFLFIIFNLIKLHPYENVYFNFFLGGLHGAKERNFPGWGNSLGQAYMGGIKWINENALLNSKLALIQGTPSNALPIFLRKDIQYLIDDNIDSYKSYFSGYEQNGEYLMELTFSDTGRDFYFAWNYINNFLNPVYELKVDGVSILKIWKNDKEHTKSLTSFAQNKILNPQINVKDKYLTIFLPSSEKLSRMIINFSSENCDSLSGALVDISSDQKTWTRELDAIPQYQVKRELNLSKGKIDFYFAGNEGRFIRIETNSSKSCLFVKPKIIIYHLH